MTKTAEIYYLVELIKAAKILYYNGLACMDDEQYDILENRLRKLDPENPLLDQPGWKEEWVKNNGYVVFNKLAEDIKKRQQQKNAERREEVKKLQRQAFDEMVKADALLKETK